MSRQQEWMDGWKLLCNQHSMESTANMQSGAGNAGSKAKGSGRDALERFGGT